MGGQVSRDTSNATFTSVAAMNGFKSSFLDKFCALLKILLEDKFLLRCM